MLIIGDFQKRTLSSLQFQEELRTEGFKKKHEEMIEEIKQLKEDYERLKRDSSQNVLRILNFAGTLLEGVFFTLNLLGPVIGCFPSASAFMKNI